MSPGIPKDLAVEPVAQRGGVGNCDEGGAIPLYDAPDFLERHAQLRPIPLIGQAATHMVAGARPEGPAPIEQA
jgi:hypothetical protein